MPSRSQLLLLLAACVGGLAVVLVLGLSYGGRLSDHGGFFRVTVADTALAVDGLRRPRKTVVVVVDGLGYAEAQTMHSLARLARHGQCRKTDVGSLSLSRPVYAVLSSGLEADRNGVRFNDDPSPLATDSLWDAAKEAGLSAAVVSELPWWRELFPRAFDAYVLGERADNFFEMAPAADVRLIHPLYVDEAGHESGADSPQYGAAVGRIDRELEQFLSGPEVDLGRDLVVVTADHGHSALGGHGGRQDRIANVLTCFAGVGVRRDAEVGRLHSTTVGPALAVLMGLRFPADMRAGDDELEVLWEIADAGAFPGAYLADRRAAVERFRAENQERVREWLAASGGSWDLFYAWHRGQQINRVLPLVGLLALTLVLQARAHRGRGGAWFGLLFVALFAAGAWALQVLLRGSFDLSSVAFREDFLRFTILLGVSWTGAAVGLHWLARRDMGGLVVDLAVLSILGTLLNVAHPVAFGWVLGFPVPPAPAFFFPYWAALFLGVMNGVGLLVCVAGAGMRRAAVRIGA
jgi:hypothetical protein